VQFTFKREAILMALLMCASILLVLLLAVLPRLFRFFVR